MIKVRKIIPLLLVSICLLTACTPKEERDYKLIKCTRKAQATTGDNVEINLSYKIYYKDDFRDVYIEGYVKTLEVPRFVQKEVAQISILCPDPYFKDIKTIVQSISKIIKKFTFPFSINEDEPIAFSTIDLEKITNVINDSESETGLIIDVLFMGTVNKLEIRNVDTGENFIIDYEFQKNDKLVINCNRGSKSVILTKDAIEYNLISYVRSGSTFFQLGIGDNNFSFLADDGNDDILVDIHFNYYKVYLGV